MVGDLKVARRQICILFSHYRIQSIIPYSQGSLSPMMTNRPARPQAFRSSGRLLPGPGPVQVMRTTAHEIHAYEVHAYEVYACEVHAREIHAYEVHTCEMHAYKMHT